MIRRKKSKVFKKLAPAKSKINRQQTKSRKIVNSRKPKELKRANMLRTPKKSSFKKRSSKHMNVKWSPDVQQIERENESVKSIKIQDPRKSTMFLKVGKDKTTQTRGIVYSEYKSKKNPIVRFTLYDRFKDPIGKIEMNIATQNIIGIKSVDYNLKNKGKTEARLLFHLGDIVWIHGSKKIIREKDCQGFNMLWLEKRKTFLCSKVETIKRVSQK